MGTMKACNVMMNHLIRSLKMYFVLRMYGAESLRRYIRHHVALAQYLADRVAEDERFEIAAPPRFGLVCFRYEGHVALGLLGSEAPTGFIDSRVLFYTYLSMIVWPAFSCGIILHTLAHHIYLVQCSVMYEYGRLLITSGLRVPGPGCAGSVGRLTWRCWMPSMPLETCFSSTRSWLASSPSGACVMSV